MAARAVTFDFWGTLFRDRDSDVRHAWRVRRLAEAAGVGEDIARNCLDRIMAEFSRCHIMEQRTLTPGDAVRMACEDLGVSISAGARAALEKDFATIILQHPPEPIERALDAVRETARYVPVGLISDTGISPGASLKILLERNGFASHMKVMVFSDEIGAAKPQAITFQAAASALGVSTEELAHIGDLEPTDIAGIQSVGGTGILFAGVNPRFREATTARWVLDSWGDYLRDLPGLLNGC